MATFRIHEDLEKENRTSCAPVQIKNHQHHILKNNNLDKRNINVFGVLDNKQNKNVNKNRADPKNKLIGGKKQQHDDVLKHVVGGNNKTGQIKKESTVPVDQFKAFTVFEDGCNENTNPENKENKPDKDENCANVSMGALRNPLSEIKDDVLSTPMSTGDCASPMSIDKSIIELDRAVTQQPKNDRDRFFEVEEYQMDILAYLKDAESRNRAKFGYMEKQPDITHAMRTILVDWLVEVCEEYRLHSETLMLAISYIDRFLSYMSVIRAKLQLVGTAAMFIASKYEEMYPPDVAEFVYITDDTYTKKQVLRMEQLILKVLSFDLSAPTTLSFISLYAVLHQIPEKVKMLAMFFCELALLDANPYLQYLPSQISAAALALAQYMLNMPMWSKKQESTLGYSLESIKDLILHLNRSHKKSLDLGQQAIQEKYKTNKNQEVSQIKPCDLDETILNKIIDEINSTEAVAQENNEDVRKMISSLIFV